MTFLLRLQLIIINIIDDDTKKKVRENTYDHIRKSSSIYSSS